MDTKRPGREAYPCDRRKPRPATKNGDWNDEEQDSEDPEAHDDGHEQAMADTVVAHDTHGRIHGDSKHEKPAHGISNLQPNALEKAEGIGGMYCLFVEPAEADHEPEALLRVCQGEVVNEHHIVVVCERAPVVFLPADEPICKEAEEGKCG